LADEIKEKYGDKIHVINIDTCKDLEEVKSEVVSVIESGGNINV
jgi:hypothetical protein